MSTESMYYFWAPKTVLSRAEDASNVAGEACRVTNDPQIVWHKGSSEEEARDAACASVCLLPEDLEAICNHRIGEPLEEAYLLSEILRRSKQHWLRLATE